MIIYVNPDCSKCQEALDLLQKNKCEFEIRNYLEIPPDKKELEGLIQQLGCRASDLVRKTEPLYLEKFEGRTLTESEWVHVLTENPVLIQRPIIVDGKQALIGRPPTLVLDLIKRGT